MQRLREGSVGRRTLARIITYAIFKLNNDDESKLSPKEDTLARGQRRDQIERSQVLNFLGNFVRIG